MKVQSEIKRARIWHPTCTSEGRGVRAMNERGDEWRRAKCDCLTKSTLKLISSISRLRLLLKTHAISYLPTVLLPYLCAEIVSRHTPMLCGITEAVALPWSRTLSPFTTKVNNHTVRNIISSWFSGNIFKRTPTRLNSRTDGCIRSGNRLIWHIFLTKMTK
jgi:hypothetical protein